MNRHSVKVTVRQEQYANRLMLIISAERLGVKMDENIKALVDNYSDATFENGKMSAQIDALHGFVDAEEIRCAEHGYKPDINTEVIRSIFGWYECRKVTEIRQKKVAEQTDEQ